MLRKKDAKTEWIKGGIDKVCEPVEWRYKVDVTPQPKFRRCSRMRQPESDPFYFAITVFYTMNREQAFLKMNEYKCKKYSGHKISATVRDISNFAIRRDLPPDAIHEFYGSQKVLSFEFNEQTRYLYLETEDEGILKIYHKEKIRIDKTGINLNVTHLNGAAIANGIRAKYENQVDSRIPVKSSFISSPMTPYEHETPFVYTLKGKYNND